MLIIIICSCVCWNTGRIFCADIGSTPAIRESLWSLERELLFFIHYAALLSRKGEYEKSNVILTECQRYFDDCGVQTIVAENHYHLGNWIRTYVPEPFFSLHRLYKIYIVLNERNKALKIADRILVKKVKIPSQTVQHIMEEMRELYYYRFLDRYRSFVS